MKLGKAQETILMALNPDQPKTVQEITDSTGLPLYKVKNILNEFHSATMTCKTKEGEYYLSKNINALKNTTSEKSFWEPVKLKNLSRVL